MAMRKDDAVRRNAMALMAALTAVVAVGCGSDDSGSSKQGSAGNLPQGAEPVDIKPGDFSPDITNPYWPMKPGTRWTYNEVEPEGKPLKVVLTATSVTKKIANGVTARVVRDTVTRDGKLIEDTFDWYAQDDKGNVWYMGEKTAEYAGGKVSTTAGSWEGGVDGALPGILMPGEPQDDMKYRQEYYKGEAEDNGEILSTEDQAEVPAGHFKDVVLTKDTITIEPDVQEYKLYARDVGLVLAFGVSGGSGREELLKVEGDIGEDAAKAAGTAPLGKPYP
jgi:hypothetical protein